MCKPTKGKAGEAANARVAPLGAAASKAPLMTIARVNVALPPCHSKEDHLGESKHVESQETLLKEEKQAPSDVEEKAAEHHQHSPKSTSSSAVETDSFPSEKHAEEEDDHAEAVAEANDMHEDDGDHGKDHEDMDLENLVAQTWKGELGEAPLLRRQKRRQRQRANAKVGRALRRFVQRKGHRNASFQEFLLGQAQRALVNYLDFLFGPMNLPEDQYLNTIILDPVYKSATVQSILHFEGIQRALAPLGPLEPELQLAITIDSLRWSQTLRCGPVCYPDGKIVYFIRLKPQPLVQQFPESTSQFAPAPPVSNAPVVTAPVMWIFVCSYCGQAVDTQLGYCPACGVMF